jgi:nitrogen regulatory protein PII-like uncharacterized protein
MPNKIAVKGVNYDVGVPKYSSTSLTSTKMTEEIGIIKNELHCNAVRIYGRDLNKLLECSNIALQAGLQVWFSPRCINATFQETLDYIKESSSAAEDLRKISPGIVYVIGNEFSLDLKGFVEGETTYERIENLSKPVYLLKNFLGQGINKELNSFLAESAAAARDNFKGEITYASGQWEKINWDLFDIISINYYRNRFNSFNYRRRIRKLAEKGKKLAVTEFGCCSYKGADKKGARGYAVVDYNGTRPRLKKNYRRDESIQSDYLVDLLNIYSSENVYAVFIYTFISRRAVYNIKEQFDLDMANFGLIKVLLPEPVDLSAPYLWEKKKAFEEVSKFYLSN